MKYFKFIITIKLKGRNIENVETKQSRYKHVMFGPIVLVYTLYQYVPHHHSPCIQDNQNFNIGLLTLIYTDLEISTLILRIAC